MLPETRPGGLSDVLDILSLIRAATTSVWLLLPRPEPEACARAHSFPKVTWRALWKHCGSHSSAQGPQVSPLPKQDVWTLRNQHATTTSPDGLGLLRVNFRLRQPSCGAEELEDAVKWARHPFSTCHSEVSAIILASRKVSPWLRSAQGHGQVNISHFDMEGKIPGLWTRGQMEPRRGSRHHRCPQHALFSHIQSELRSQGQVPQPCALGKFITVPRGRLNVGMWLPCLLRTKPSSSLKKAGAGSPGTGAWNTSIFCSFGILINVERNKKTPLRSVLFKCQVEPVCTNVRPRERRP